MPLQPHLLATEAHSWTLSPLEITVRSSTLVDVYALGLAPVYWAKGSRNDRPVAAPILMMCFGYDLDTTLYEVWIAVCLYVCVRCIQIHGSWAGFGLTC